MLAVSFECVCVGFCFSGSEAMHAERLNSFDEIRAIVPLKTKREKKAGKWREFEMRIMPGYVFIYGTSIKAIQTAASKCGVRLLDYDKECYALYGEDLEFARYLWTHDGHLGVSLAASDGDRLIVLEGPLKGNEAVIKRIDKRHMLVQVELKICSLKTWLSFDWVDKYENGTR